jgi:hypothetical protein
MKFTDVSKDKKFVLNDLGFGEYFRIGKDFYIKTDIDYDYRDYYVINLVTGKGFTMTSDTEIVPITVKEFVYEDT